MPYLEIDYNYLVVTPEIIVLETYNFHLVITKVLFKLDKIFFLN